MKSPIITRKKYDKDTRDKEDTIAIANHKIEYLRKQLILASKATNEILPRLVRIRKPIQNKEFGTYRVCVEFHRDMVERCFTHGGDDDMIQYFADSLSEKVRLKMIQFNFARCNWR